MLAKHQLNNLTALPMVPPYLLPMVLLVLLMMARTLTKHSAALHSTHQRRLTAPTMVVTPWQAEIAAMTLPLQMDWTSRLCPITFLQPRAAMQLVKNVLVELLTSPAQLSVFILRF